MARLIANRPMKIMRGKEEINGLRLPKERSSKSMRIIRSKEEVNGPGEPRE